MLRERIKLLSSSDRRFTDRASTARESTALDTNRTDRDPLEGSMTIRTILPSREGPRDTREGTREGTRAVTREGIRETKPPSPTATEKFFQTETDLSFRGPSNITNYMIKPMYRSKSRGDIRALRDSKNKDDFSTLAFFSNQNQDKEKDEFKVQNLVLATEPVLERELSESPELSPEKTAPMVKSFTQLLFYPTGKMQSQPDYKKDSRKPDKVSIDKLKFKLLRKKDYKHYASLMKEKDNETYNKLFEKLTAMSKTKNSAMDSPAVEPTMKVMVKSKHSMFRVREREIGDQSTQQATMVFQTTKEVKDGGAVDNTIRLISL